MQQNDLEYVLFVQTLNYGQIGMLLRDGGRHLGLARVEDPSFYRLVGEEPPPEVNIGNKTIVKGVKPDWKIPLHGEWQNIGEVVEQLYSQNIDAEEEIVSHNNFFSRHRIAAALVGSFAAVLPLAFGSLIRDIADIPWQLYYSIAGTWAAGVVGGIIYYEKKLDVERDREGKIIKDLGTHLRELESVREGIIRAGVLDGILPQNYGLQR